LKKVIETYSEAYRKHGRSLASLLLPKGRQNERFSVLTSAMQGSSFSVLDFGCGFGDLKVFLDRNFREVRYTGVDVMPDFIKECRDIHGPQTDFRLIEGYRDIAHTFDYVVVSGVFNTLYHDTREQHWAAVQDIMRHLFAHTRRAFAFDFMTDQVDFTAPGAFHQNPMEAYRFAHGELSRRVKLDQSYLPYEFAFIVHKDADIQRPDNVYRAD
jgi:cyclopropane fatty-acyl-phospholipid synthase-like methyltransferase